MRRHTLKYLVQNPSLDLLQTRLWAFDQAMSLALLDPTIMIMRQASVPAVIQLPAIREPIELGDRHPKPLGEIARSRARRQRASGERAFAGPHPWRIEEVVVNMRRGPTAPCALEPAVCFDKLDQVRAHRMHQIRAEALEDSSGEGRDPPMLVAQRGCEPCSKFPRAARTGQNGVGQLECDVMPGHNLESPINAKKCAARCSNPSGPS